MQIYGPVSVHGPQPISAPHSTRPVQETQPASSAAADELQISDAGRYLEQARQLPEIRSDRVAALRAAIADGAYETNEKLEIALSRLFDEMA